MRLGVQYSVSEGVRLSTLHVQETVTATVLCPRRAMTGKFYGKRDGLRLAGSKDAVPPSAFHLVLHGGFGCRGSCEGACRCHCHCRGGGSQICLRATKLGEGSSAVAPSICCHPISRIWVALHQRSLGGPLSPCFDTCLRPQSWHG